MPVTKITSLHARVDLFPIGAVELVTRDCDGSRSLIRLGLTCRLSQEAIDTIRSEFPDVLVDESVVVGNLPTRLAIQAHGDAIALAIRFLAGVIEAL